MSRSNWSNHGMPHRSAQENRIEFRQQEGMRIANRKYLRHGSRPAVIFAVLIALILGGNGLLIWQFHQARQETERLMGVNRQLISLLRLHDSLVLFHVRLDQLAQARDAQRLLTESEPLRRNLLEQTQRTRNILTELQSQTGLDPAFLATLEAIEITLPSQVDALKALVASGDWEAVRFRVSDELIPLETESAAIVSRIDGQVSEALKESVRNMESVQRRIFLLVPITAISTFCAAALFGWSITQRMSELRMEERVNERMRIARELHDTLLQGFIGARMQLDTAADQLPEDSTAKTRLARVLQIMGEVIDEGRSALHCFRTGESDTENLEKALSKVPEELQLKDPVNFRLIVEGHAQSLRPLIQHEVYSIGREALLNSFRHSGASRIEVELEYSASQLRVLARDDGRGIDAQVLEFGRQGHWGLSGMRERAERIGAQLKILSRAGVGTEVELCIPGSIAFDSPASNSSDKP